MADGDASGCLESLFNPRDGHDFLPQVIELKVGDGDEKTQPFHIYDAAYWQRSISGALVNKRGWVLQERSLSACVLFDKRQVLWECLQKSATETSPERIRYEMLGRGRGIVKGMGNRIRRIAVNVWASLIKEYTTCDLTVPSDLEACPHLQNSETHSGYSPRWVHGWHVADPTRKSAALAGTKLPLFRLDVTACEAERPTDALAIPCLDERDGMHSICTI